MGAGLLGCFAARALTQYELRILVLEQREDVCTGISKANTGIVYSGCDTKPSTLKTRLCVQANAGFDALCRDLGVPFDRCGSLMVSCGPRAEAIVRKKFEQGKENGVPGLALLTAEQVLEEEPNLSHTVTGGLYVPGTGTVNPWELGIAAFENAQKNGAEFHFCEKLLHISRQTDGFLLETEKGRYKAKALLNCAGLAADSVRELLMQPRLRLFPSAADYLVLDDTARGFIRHVIFHEPEMQGKGLTLVPTVDGNLLVGPTEHAWDGCPGRGTTIEGLSELHSLCREIVPALDLAQTIRNFGSLRPNPYGVYPDENGILRQELRSISSFTILEEEGLFSLIGIKTPGLTCAWELGQYTARKITGYLGNTRSNASFDPIRPPMKTPRTMSEAEREALIRKEPEYGRLLCRCREITCGEALDAIRRGAVTVDGVKRRTGAGMGRCQGGWCMQPVLEMLAQQRGLPPAAVTKDGADSIILQGDNHGSG